MRQLVWLGVLWLGVAGAETSPCWAKCPSEARAARKLGRRHAAVAQGSDDFTALWRAYDAAALAFLCNHPEFDGAALEHWLRALPGYAPPQSEVSTPVGGIIAVESASRTAPIQAIRFGDDAVVFLWSFASPIAAADSGGRLSLFERTGKGWQKRQHVQTEVDWRPGVIWWDGPYLVLDERFLAADMERHNVRAFRVHRGQLEPLQTLADLLDAGFGAVGQTLRVHYSRLPRELSGPVLGARLEYAGELRRDADELTYSTRSLTPGLETIERYCAAQRHGKTSEAIALVASADLLPMLPSCDASQVITVIDDHEAATSAEIELSVPDELIPCDVERQWFAQRITIGVSWRSGRPQIVSSRSDDCDISRAVMSPCLTTDGCAAIGAPTVLAAAQYGPLNVIADGDNVYWNTEQRIVKAPASGGILSVLAVGDEPVEIAVDREFVYWAERRGDIMRVPKGGGASKALVRIGGTPLAVAADDTTIFMTTADGKILTVDKKRGRSRVLVGGIAVGTDLAVDLDRVYWLDVDGSLWMIAKRGGEPTRLGRGLGAVSGFAVRNGVAYLAVAESVIALASGADEPVVLASSQAAPTHVATDGERVYWTNAGDGSVIMVSIAGGSPTRMLAGGENLSTLAVNGDALFVSDTLAFSIVKIAK